MCLLAWSGTGIHEMVTSDGGYVNVPDNAYIDVCITSVELVLEKAEQTG
jgi:acetyl-CoA carboxylase/biotin carboxylase 1